MPKDIRSFFKPISSKTATNKDVEDEKTVNVKSIETKSKDSKKKEISKSKSPKNKKSIPPTKAEVRKKHSEVFPSDDDHEGTKKETKGKSVNLNNLKKKPSSTKKKEVVSSDSETDVVEKTPRVNELKKSNLIDESSGSDTDVVEATPQLVSKWKKTKPKVILSSDSESDDVKIESRVKKTRKNVIHSDSEDEKPPIKILKKEQTKKPVESLKPVDISKIFEKSTVKQSKTVIPEPKVDVEKKSKPKMKKKTEIGIHDDEKFEKTLLELDDDDIFVKNEDILEKTINEAMEKTKTPPKVKEEQKKKTPEKNQKNVTPRTSKESRKRLLDEGKVKDDTPKSKKAKFEHADSGFDDQDRNEKKKYCAMLYQNYKSRSGPKNHGCKEYPKGKPNCLTNLCFLRTGVLDSLEGEEFEEMVKKYGGRTVHAVSKKVDYVVAGDDAGPSKMQKAESYKIPIINEDEFLDIILEKSGMPKKYHNNVTTSFEDVGISDSYKSAGESEEMLPKEEESPEKVDDVKTESKPIESENDDVCLSEKYKPKVLKEIIGHQSNNSCMNKLKLWLENWEKNEKLRKLKKIKQPTPWDKNNDGSYYKCALLSGPPGVGKTTTATLVASTLNYDTVEFNASDTRSKKLLQEDIANALGTKTISTSNAKVGGKRVLIMDEVDGMAGNEDRGGMQELIRLIKISKIPIICMCNDRNHEKIRSLSNYCYDLRFEKPKPQQLMGFVMSICCKEGIKMSPQIAMEMINGTGCDIRQTLNQIAMISNVDGGITLEQAQKDASASKKDTVLGPWQVTRMVFDEKDQKNMSLIDKSRLFFYDYSFGPLFIQENYLKVQPNVPRCDVMKRVAAAADAISKGATISRMIRESNNWSLLDTQAIFSSVLPGYYMSGQFNGAVDFPSFLGKLSKKNKLRRLQTELYNHTQSSTSGGASAILDYCKPLLKSIVNPLRKKGLDGVREAVDIMKNYQLLREDLDSLAELATWPGQKNLMEGVDSKVKTSFTKLYNKETPLFSHSISTSVSTSKKKISTIDANEYEMDVDDDDDDEDEGKIENDKNIKVKTKTKNDKNKASTSKQKSTTKGSRKK